MEVEKFFEKYLQVKSKKVQSPRIVLYISQDKRKKVNLHDIIGNA